MEQEQQEQQSLDVGEWTSEQCRRYLRGSKIKAEALFNDGTFRIVGVNNGKIIGTIAESKASEIDAWREACRAQMLF